MLKGILDIEDARQAVHVGADGIVVSNHGGRQLDGVRSTISVLPEIVQGVGKQLEVWMDGGIRSGTDVFKAIALGARGVMIGRTWAWALAGNGSKGLENCLASLQRELRLAMVLTGARTIADIDSSRLVTGPTNVSCGDAR